MKKEKRELTLKELEKRYTILNRMVIVASIIAFLIIFTLMPLSFADLISSEIFVLLVVIVLVLAAISIVFIVISNNIANKYNLKIDGIKLKTLNELAGDGNNLKEFVDIGDREIVEDILCIGIDKIVIRPVESKENEIPKKDSKFKLSVSLKNGCTIMPVSISDDDFFKLLNSKLETEILKEVITDINLYSEEDYPEDETDLIISGKSLYYERRIREEDLLDILDLKDEEE